MLQRNLVELGYNIKVDGRYGPATTTAVVAFQKANGLKADGVAGELTEAAVRGRLDGAAPAIGSPVVSDAPSPAAPTAGGLATIGIAEAG